MTKDLEIFLRDLTPREDMVWRNIHTQILGYSMISEKFFGIPSDYRLIAVRVGDGWSEVDIDAGTALAMGLYELKTDNEP